MPRYLVVDETDLQRLPVPAQRIIHRSLTSSSSGGRSYCLVRAETLTKVDEFAAVLGWRLMGTHAVRADGEAQVRELADRAGREYMIAPAQVSARLLEAARIVTAAKLAADAPVRVRLAAVAENIEVISRPVPLLSADEDLLDHEGQSVEVIDAFIAANLDVRYIIRFPDGSESSAAPSEIFG